MMWLYGTTPPRAGASVEQISTAASRLVERIRPLPLDGVLVYDVQDESSRTALPRPFPFLPTIDPREYAGLLRAQLGLPLITYKCVAEMSRQAWDAWLDETDARFHGTHISLVGRSATGEQGPALSLSQALQIAAAHPARFSLGGVVIPERHTATRSESRRVIHKAEAGCSLFVSQAVYDANATIRLLADYARDCRELGIRPQRIVLTFVPCGRPRTMEFIEWLGVSIPEHTRRSILDAPAPLSASIRLCCEALLSVLDQPFVQELSLGVNVESVSINRAEIDASIELFYALQDVAAPAMQR